MDADESGEARRRELEREFNELIQNILKENGLKSAEVLRIAEDPASTEEDLKRARLLLDEIKKNDEVLEKMAKGLENIISEGLKNLTITKTGIEVKKASE